MPSYSASVRPSSRCGAAANVRPRRGPCERLEQPPAVGGPGERVHRVLGVRHQAHHVAGLVADAGHVVHRPVRVVAGRVAQHDLLVRQRAGRRVVAPGRVLHRDREQVALAARAREGRVRVLDRHLDLAAHEAQRVVRQQRAREQPGLAEHLEAVADAEHRPAVARELDHRLHQRREASDGAHAQVVAVGEAAGHDHGVDAAEVAVAVPEQVGVGEAAAGHEGVDLVAGAREADHAELHAASSSSITS